MPDGDNRAMTGTDTSEAIDRGMWVTEEHVSIDCAGSGLSTSMVLQDVVSRLMNAKARKGIDLSPSSSFSEMTGSMSMNDDDAENPLRQQWWLRRVRTWAMQFIDFRSRIDNAHNGGPGDRSLNGLSIYGFSWSDFDVSVRTFVDDIFISIFYRQCKILFITIDRTCDWRKVNASGAACSMLELAFLLREGRALAETDEYCF